jgi:hypothetical protein
LQNPWDELKCTPGDRAAIHSTGASSISRWLDRGSPHSVPLIDPVL